MHIENLKIFRDLVDNESFSKAAKLNDITQSAVSQHLMRLRAHGLVAAEREGRVARYRVAHAGCLTILGCIRSHFAK